MIIFRAFKILLLISLSVLTGCAANQLPGFQNTYYSYNIPPSLIGKINFELNKNNLTNAKITRDSVGRVRLIGSYKNEDEVDRAFIIVQSIVGIKSTSPFYPEDIKEKRWEANAKLAMENFTKTNPTYRAKPEKRALIIGINTFLNKSIGAIYGEDDARLVNERAMKAGYITVPLFGDQATKYNIETALNKMKAALGPDDSLLIYISSHGEQPLPSSKGGDARKMSVIAYDTKTVSEDGIESRLKMHDTSVSDTKFQELAQIPVKQKRIIIDTCFSGDILQGVSDTSAQYILETNGGQPERAGVSLASWTGPEFLSKGIKFREDTTAATPPEKEKAKPSKWLTAGQDNSYIIITATSDGQKSWGPHNGIFESPVTVGKNLKGSFFTQAFFEYLDKHQGHLEPAFQDAKEYTYKKVKSIPPEKSSGSQPLQTPRMEPKLQTNDKINLYY